MLNNQIITGKDAILAAIVEVNKQGKTWQDQVQVVAVSICLRIHEHGDYRIVSNLLRDFPKGAKSTAIVAYLNAFAPIAIEVKGQELDIVFDSEKRQYPTILETGSVEEVESYKQFLTDMMNKGWETFKPAPVKKALNLPKAFTDLAKKVSDHIQSPINGDNMPKALVEFLQILDGDRPSLARMLAKISTADLEAAIEQRYKDEENEKAIETEIAAIDKIAA